jgi:hypothetical protein
MTGGTSDDSTRRPRPQPRKVRAEAASAGAAMGLARLTISTYTA